MVLTREQLLARDDFPTKDVDIGGGETVRLRALNVREMADWLDRDGGDKGQRTTADNMRRMTTLVAVSLVGEDGQRLFTLEEASACPELSVATINKLFEAAAELNALTVATVKAAEKNSGAGQGESSSSS